MTNEDERRDDGQLPTVFVDQRNRALHDDSLGMKCDAKEIPDPIKPAASYLGKQQLTLRDVVGAKSNQTRWIAAGSFVGQARAAGGGAIEKVSTEAGQPVAMTVVETEQCLLGILGQKDPAAPAIWWAWPLTELSVDTEGVQGMLRKRPRQISIIAFGSQVDLIEVSSVRNDKSSFTMGQEAAFMKALRVGNRV
jgi:hypothetical protein